MLEALVMGMVLARERVRALVRKTAGIKEAVTPEVGLAMVVDRSRRHLLEVGEQEELEELVGLARVVVSAMAHRMAKAAGPR